MHPLLPELERYDQIIWDWNGTLLEDLAHNVRTMNALLDSVSLPTITVDDHRKYFRFPVVEYYKILGFDISPDNFFNLSETFNAAYQTGIGNCELMPGIRNVLQHLKAAQKTQSILSASKQDALERAIMHFKLSNIFQYVFGIDDNLAASKLERGRELIALSGIPPESSVLVGDTDHDVHVGNALGIDVVLVDTGHQSFERLREVHNRVIRCSDYSEEHR